MTNIKFITMVGCHNCEKVKGVFEGVLPSFPDVKVEEIDATSDDGQELIQKYGIMSSPGIVIDGELFSVGGVDREKLIEKLESLK